ncbi:tryptophan-rich sensory protein [Streptomyces sp. NPDC058534]|uniref:tryptophan-rich sensory protein n=1 Tax=Streptomyces sp. NPDC058534 TaxID=3346541 RepID=UPI00366473D6
MWTVLYATIAFANICLLLAALTATLITFRRKRRTAALLLLPCTAWVAYAAALNGGCREWPVSPPASREHEVPWTPRMRRTSWAAPRCGSWVRRPPRTARPSWSGPSIWPNLADSPVPTGPCRRQPGC